MIPLNDTHDPQRRSWVTSANVDRTDFPIQNLPFGVFEIGGEAPRGGVAIGDQIFDLAAGVEANLFQGEALTAARAASGADLTPLLALGGGPASALRARLSDLLRVGGAHSLKVKDAADRLLMPMADADLLLPVRVRQFTDMCVSTFHIGRQSGNDANGQPITPPVFRTVPVGYDGRASSVVISGTPVRRPNGTWLAKPGDTAPTFGPEPRQDYEMEVGLWFGGPANALGDPIDIADASAAIFGYCLLNDWSARGIQMWEMMLGPFLGKSLATTISPWIVTTEALAPFRTQSFERPSTDPAAPQHLLNAEDQRSGGIDLTLDAYLETETMRAHGHQPNRICRTNFRHMYWTPAQMLTHHTSNGCSLGAGDLVGSGTCSGPELNEAACLLESLLAGDLALTNGERRSFLEDGDAVVLRGRADRVGYVGLGFGEARGQILPAHPHR